MKKTKKIKKTTFLVSTAFVLIALSLLLPGIAFAQEEPIPFPEVENSSSVVNIILLLTILSIAPAILLMMTCFTRIIIVLSFTRSGIGAQQMPPNQVLIGLALFLTFFIMQPVLSEINREAYRPLMQGEINTQEALERGKKPLKEFMLKNTYSQDLNLFIELSGKDAPETYDELPMTTVVPAFAISELKRGFQMGFFILIPFIVIDMIVASTLMSMGMMMLPPTMISLPFKVLLFVLVDGWSLTVKTLVESFGG
ncbi:MAG TPA: flagellar type III secretion system pore protein FliP [Clostridia bacterium]|jgi:flagellar biosynthetic protein FliP|nr:flagellar type III secretion system pore protein FliP [Clostridia bacterium]